MHKPNRVLITVGATAALAISASSGSAFAQDGTDGEHDRQTAQAAQHDGMAEAREMARTFGVSEINEIEDWKVMHSGMELGEIDRVAIDRNTRELLAVVGLEDAGAVDLNLKEVAIPLKDLEKSGSEALSTEMTRAELQKKRDIDPWDGSYTQVVNPGAAQ